MCGQICVPHVCLCTRSQVLITIYWLGRKAHLDAFYSGPQLNFKAFEGLLGLALSKVSYRFSPIVIIIIIIITITTCNIQ